MPPPPHVIYLKFLSTTEDRAFSIQILTASDPKVTVGFRRDEDNSEPHASKAARTASSPGHAPSFPITE